MLLTRCATLTLLVFFCVTGGTTAAQDLSPQRSNRWLAPADTFAADPEVASATEVDALLEELSFQRHLTLRQVLAADGLRVVPNAPAFDFGRTEEGRVLAVAVEPIPDLNMHGATIALLLVTDDEITPLLLDLGQSAGILKVQLIGTDVAMTLESSSAGAVTKATAPFAPLSSRGDSHERARIGVNALSLSETVSCVIDQFALSGDMLCAIGEYLFCFGTAQIPTTSVGAAIGCARPILKAMLKDAGKAKSLCTATVDLAKCLVGSSSNSAPKVTIDNLQLVGKKLTVKATASDSDKNLTSFAVFQRAGSSVKVVIKTPSNTCSLDKSKTTCTATFDADVSQTAVTIVAQAEDSSGVSGSASRDVPLRFTVKGSTAVGGVKFSVNNTTFTSAKDGTYVISGLPPGTYTLVPTKTGCTFTPSSLKVNVGPDLTGQNFKKSGTACK